jgi:hypothetical protein
MNINKKTKTFILDLDLSHRLRHLASYEETHMSNRPQQDDFIDAPELFEGYLAEEPVIGSLPGGKHFASCTIRLTRGGANTRLSGNLVWNLIVHRPPAVEMMKCAYPGDFLEIRGVLQGSSIVVPKTDGRIDILLAD